MISTALYQEDMRYQKTGTFSGHHVKDLEWVAAAARRLTPLPPHHPPPPPDALCNVFRMFINRPLGRIVSIDTKPQSVGAQPSNAIIIKVSHPPPAPPLKTPPLFRSMS